MTFKAVPGLRGNPNVRGKLFAGNPMTGHVAHPSGGELMKF
jgi:hypothetical protein